MPKSLSPHFVYQQNNFHFDKSKLIIITMIADKMTIISTLQSFYDLCETRATKRVLDHRSCGLKITPETCHSMVLVAMDPRSVTPLTLKALHGITNKKVNK